MDASKGIIYGVSLLLAIITIGAAFNQLQTMPPWMVSVNILPAEPQSDNVTANRTVTLGLIIGSNSSAPRLDYAARRGIDDVNTYCQARGIPWRFNLVEVVTSDPIQQIEAIQNYNAKGVKIMFCDWNTPICLFQTYMVIQNITMIGVPDSHCRSHKQVDSIYRMSPNTTEETRALTATLRAMGIRALIILRDDYTIEYLSTILPREGSDIETIVEIRYNHTEASELSEWLKKDSERSRALMNRTTSKLNELLRQYKPQEVGVVYAFPYLNENHLRELGSHPELLSVTWYTTPLLNLNQTTLSKYTDISSKIHLLGLELPKPGNSEYLLLEKGYEESPLYTVNDASLGLKEASLYDSVKIAALSVIQSGSSKGKGLQAEIQLVAANYLGASGRMTLDSNGDRVKSDFEIYGFYDVNGVTQWINVGHFDSERGETRIILSLK